MFRNFFKTAWRNIWRNKGFSLINIAGLSVSMAAAMLIVLWIGNELSFDRFHANRDVLYKVWNRSTYEGKTSAWDITAAPLGPALKKDFPEIQAFARTYWPEPHLFNYKEQRLTATGLSVDAAFLTMFSFPLLEGNAGHALDDVNAIVITRKLARKLFGDQDPINRMIRLDDTTTLKVTGVLKDLPANTQFDFEYLLPWAHLKETYRIPGWEAPSYNTYVVLRPDISAAAANRKIENIYRQYTGSTDTRIFLYPISRWHLYDHFENGYPAGGRIRMVRLLGIVAALLLLIACINFMNLSTAGGERRAREIGVRKVTGASKRSLILQFFGESTLLVLVAGILAWLWVLLFLPAFNDLTGRHLSLNYGNPYLWLAGVAFILITGVLAGSYPAIFLSSFQPVKVLKGGPLNTKTLVTPRKMLVVTQFTVSIILIISTLIIYRQIRYAQQRDNGYAENNLLELDINGDIRKNYPLIKNDLLNSGVAAAVCKSSLSITTNGSSSTGFSWSGKDPDTRVSFDLMATTGDFVKTFGIKLLAGRDIDLSAFPADSNACLLNESAVKAIGFKTPVGQLIKEGGFTWKVVGVVKDFIIGSPYQPVNPVIIKSSDTWAYRVNIRLNPRQPLSYTISRIGDVFKKYNPAYPFEYRFVDEEYNKKFSDEQRIGRLSRVFALLTVFISCLGLFGLAILTAHQRTKEIGIRKVLGASISGIALMISSDFLKLILLAIIIASPVAWWMMYKWLQEFAYRIHPGIGIFLAAGVLALLIALITVSYQAVKAATANPVKSLRSE
ncbi:ABC transporter permease [Compostibacter hankyongensis]|uniref:ABC transporter permease n=1 Tax=Compostibacter hankyongensis TaxID=1007089 RepID=A0ABP8FM85_9BACT